MSVLLLSVFYLTNFELVGFIPKPAFSSLLVLAFIDMISNWFVRSYFKTKEKVEWLVVPLIVLLAFLVGLLQAVFLGIAMSTFLFVGTFFRSGVVKYMATGLNIRSTIERPPNVARWLDRNADQLQILVLQNYLFFGNASSILSYITTMFEEPDPDVDPMFVPPCPKIIILDLTLVTGMDTSAVDAFSDILAVCSNHDCKLFLSGVSKSLRQVMSLCGIEPENIPDRSQRKLRFFGDLDGAIGKAEDYLIKTAPFEVDSTADAGPARAGGFRHALSQIDEQHLTSFADDLCDLEEYSTVVDMETGDLLYDDPTLERGLFFIEYGIMKIERISEATISRSGIGGTFNRGFQRGTLNAMSARAESVGREMARLKAGGLELQHTPRFRVARGRTVLSCYSVFIARGRISDKFFFFKQLVLAGFSVGWKLLVALRFLETQLPVGPTSNIVIHGAFRIVFVRLTRFVFVATCKSPIVASTTYRTERSSKSNKRNL